MTNPALPLPAPPSHGRPVYVRGDDDKARIVALALGLPICQTAGADDCLQLIAADAGLELYDPRDGARLRVQFSRADINHFRAGGSGMNPLRRAIGPGRRRVVDATAGLGRDAVHLAALGYRVTAIERNPVIGRLALDGIERAREAKLLPPDNPRWIIGDACAVLPSLADAPDTIYLDPMFPPKRKKSAAVRKEMRLLRDLTGDDDDVARLFAMVRTLGAERTVVKRPIAAPALAPNPHATYRGKLVRYDVYASHRAV